MAGDRRSGEAERMTAALFLGRSEVERLLTPEVCLAALEQAFRLLGERTAPAPGALAMHAEAGSFHVKAGMLTTDRAYFAAKPMRISPGTGRAACLPSRARSS